MPSRRAPIPSGSDVAGTLVIIGGGEDKEDDPTILRDVGERVDGGPLVILTCATEDPDGAWARYRDVFAELGVRTVPLDVRDRAQALDDSRSRCLEDATGVFMTGGDQLRITAHLGDTPAFQRIRELYHRGGVVAGTSAGAAVMTETMLVSGESEATPTIRDIVQMAPGFGFLQGAIVDMHFAERGRLGRLLGAIAQNPRYIGIGIDEDTAIVVQQRCLEVIGSGAVYIADAAEAANSNVADGSGDAVLTIDDVVLHVLNAGRRYDLAARRPA